MVVFIPIGVIHSNTNPPDQLLLFNPSHIISFREILSRTLRSLNWSDEQIKTKLNELNLETKYLDIKAIHHILNQDPIRNSLSKERSFSVYILKGNTDKNEVEAYRELIFIEGHWSYSERKEPETKLALQVLLEQFRLKDEREEVISQETQSRSPSPLMVTEADEIEPLEQVEEEPWWVEEYGLTEWVDSYRYGLLGRDRNRENSRGQARYEKITPVDEWRETILSQGRDYHDSVNQALFNYFNCSRFEKKETFIMDAILSSFLQKIEKLNEPISDLVNEKILKKIIIDQKIVEKILDLFVDEEFDCPLTYAKPKKPFWIEKRIDKACDMKTYDGEALLKAYIENGKSPLTRFSITLEMLVSGINPSQVSLILDDLLTREFKTACEGLAAFNASLITKASFTNIFQSPNSEDETDLTATHDMASPS